MSTPEQPQEKQKQPTVVEYSHKTDIELIIRSAKGEFQKALRGLTEDKDVSKTCAMAMGITQEECNDEQDDIKESYITLRRRLKKGGTAEETILLCDKLIQQHHRSTAWNNLIKRKNESQTFEIPEESDGDLMLDSTEPKPKKKLPPPNFDEIQKMTQPKEDTPSD